LIFIYRNTYFYKGLAVWSHCSLCYGGRTMSSSLRSSAGRAAGELIHYTTTYREMTLLSAS